MRKIFNKFFALSLMTSAFFVSCSNETEKTLESAPKTIGVTLNLPAMNQSKGVGPQTTSGQKVTVTGTVILKALASENGAVLNTFTREASEFFNNGTPVTVPLEVNGTATYISFDGNINTEAKTDDVNTRQGNATSDAVRVNGTAVINNSVCNIPVTPDMARVEVYGSFGSSFSHITDLKMNGIYLNNVKQNRTDANLVKSTNTSTPSWDDVYTEKGTKSNLYTLFAGGVTGIADAGSVKQADGYNFYPQSSADAGVNNVTTKEEASKFTPHIILNVTYTQNGTAHTKWLNVVAMKKDGNLYVDSFVRGSIYQINLADLISVMDQINPPVTDVPDPDAISVEVNVTVADWQIVPVKPEV